MTRPPFEPSTAREITKGGWRSNQLERRPGCGPWIYVDSGAPAPAFQNGWSNMGGGFTPMRFRLNLHGGVDLEGGITGGADGTVVFTLPALYTPDYEVRLAATDTSNNFVVFGVETNGDVTYQPP